MQVGCKTKVLFLIESLSGGGAEKVLSTLVKHLDKSKFDITLCCLTNVGKYIEDVKPYVNYKYVLPDPSRISGVRLFLYKVQYWLIYKCLSPSLVYRLFVPKGADVEVAFVEGFSTKLLSGSTNGQSKKIAWTHTDFKTNHWPIAKGIFKDLEEERGSYLRFDGVVAVSNSVRESFEGLLGTNIPSVSVLYNPVDTEEIVRLSQVDVGCPSKSVFRMISLGRLVPQKAFDMLLRTVSRLKDDGFSFELWLLGEGPCWWQLEQIIRDEHLGDMVTLWGFKDNPYPYLAASDLFVCSSVAEGYSTAASEAIVLGLPVVTTDCSGMRELLGNSQAGIIVNNSEEALYHGIKTIMEVPASLEKYRQNALKLEKTLSVRQRVRLIEEILS